MSNPRHAAPSRTAALAGRVALGVIGAPVAMLAVAGPAVADPDAQVLEMGADGRSFEAAMAAPDLALPGTDALGTDALGTGALGADALPTADDLAALATLPGTDSLPAADSLPGTDSLPGADALDTGALDTGALDTDALDTDALAMDLPVDMALDLDADPAAAEDLPADLDVFSTSDLLGGLI